TESSQADESPPDEGSADSAETEGTPSDTE
ncbi:unnamed protein product, partial [marine sediment metagenome]